MKKIIKFFICLIFLMLLVVRITINAEVVEISDFTLDVINELGQSKTKLKLNWKMEEEISEFQVKIKLSNGQEELSYVKSYTNGRDNLGKCEISKNEDGSYDYLLTFEIDVVRTGSFNIEIKYKVGDSWYEYRNYVIAKGDVVDTKYFTKGKAVLVGVIISIFTIIGSLLIFESSKSEYELIDDQTTITKSNKKVNK